MHISKKKSLALVSILLCCVLIKCKKEDKNNNEISHVSIVLNISGPVYQGDYYSGYVPLTDVVIWIEDENHNFIKTLYISPTVVTIDTSHGSHLFHLPNWLNSSEISYEELEIENEFQPGIPPSFDAISGASLSITETSAYDTICVNWDLTDQDSIKVGKGIYYYCAEASNITKYQNTNYVEQNCEINAEITFGEINLFNNTTKEATTTPYIKSLIATLLYKYD